eukprot:1189313-Prorocentrum_minimum.AAC.3
MFQRGTISTRGGEMRFKTRKRGGVREVAAPRFGGRNRARHRVATSSDRFDQTVEVVLDHSPTTLLLPKCATL